MIQGRLDTYFTVEEFAAMVGREPKTVENWAAAGKLRFMNLFGVPLISLKMIESLIEGRIPGVRDDGTLARRIAGAPRPGPGSAGHSSPRPRQPRGRPFSGAGKATPLAKVTEVAR